MAPKGEKRGGGLILIFLNKFSFKFIEKKTCLYEGELKKVYILIDSVKVSLCKTIKTITILKRFTLKRGWIHDPFSQRSVQSSR